MKKGLLDERPQPPSDDNEGDEYKSKRKRRQFQPLPEDDEE